MIRFSNSSTGPQTIWFFFTKSRITWILWGPQNLALVGNRVPDGTPNSNGLSSSVLLKRPERGLVNIPFRDNPKYHIQAG